MGRRSFIVQEEVHSLNIKGKPCPTIPPPPRPLSVRLQALGQELPSPTVLKGLTHEPPRKGPSGSSRFRACSPHHHQTPRPWGQEHSTSMTPEAWACPLLSLGTRAVCPWQMTHQGIPSLGREDTDSPMWQGLG